MTAVSSYDPAVRDHLTIEHERDAHGIVVALRGALDLASAPEVDRRLRELEGVVSGRLLVDLGGLDFVDSTGLAVMIRARQAAEADGHRLTVRLGSDQVQRLFELTRLVDHFTFED